MDPNAALTTITTALEDGDFPAAASAADDLRGWLSSGGFPPDGWSPAAQALLEGISRAGEEYPPLATSTQPQQGPRPGAPRTPPRRPHAMMTARENAALNRRLDIRDALIKYVSEVTQGHPSHLVGELDDEARMLQSEADRDTIVAVMAGPALDAYAAVRHLEGIIEAHAAEHGGR